MPKIALGFVLVISYYLLAKLGLQLVTINDNISPIWPASGFAVFVLYRFGLKAAPAIFIGAVLANAQTQSPWPVILGIGCGNMLEAIVGMWVLNWFKSQKRHFFFHNETLGILTAGIVSAAVSATVGVSAITGKSLIPFQQFFSSWMVWWSGDMLGIWLILALASIGRTHFKKNLSQAPAAYFFIVLAAAAFSAWVLFFQEALGTVLILHLLVLLMVWTTNKALSISGSIFICALAIGATTFGLGPFAAAAEEKNLLDLQLLIGTITLSAVVLNNLKINRPYKVPFSLYLLGCCLSAMAMMGFHQWEENWDNSRFNSMISQSMNNLSTTVAIYENALASAVSLYSASQEVTREEWAAYVHTHMLHERYAGANVIGVIVPVETQKLDELVSKERKGLPGFHIRHYSEEPSPHSEHFIIKYSEPFEPERNVVGMDLSSEPQRRQAVLMARDTASFTITRPIPLAFSDPVKWGFLAFYPFYKGPNPPETQQGREKNLRGLVYASFSMNNFFSRAFGPDKNLIEVDIYYDDPASGDILVFSTLPTPHERYRSDKGQTSKIVFGNRSFKLIWRRGQAYSDYNRLTTVWAGTIGMILTLLVIGFVSNLEALNDRANQAALGKTRQIRLVLRISEFLNSRAKPDVILQDILETVVTEMDYDLGLYWSTTEPTEPLTLHAKSVKSPLLKNLAFGSPGPDVMKAWYTPEVPFAANAREELASLGATPEALDASGTCFSIPVCRSSKNFGVLQFFSSENKPQDQAIVSTLADIGNRLAAYLDNFHTDRELEMQKQKFVEVSKMSALGEMSGGIAHEINNPLAIIQMKSILLQTLASRESVDPAVIRQETQSIIHTVDRIAKIIRGLKSFARNSKDDPFLPVALTQVIEDTLILCSERFKNNQVDLIVDGHNIRDVELRCRESEISQIILNLLNNAFDAIQGLPKKWVKVSFRIEKNFVKILVQDSGSGISPEIAAKVMQPFFTTKDVGHGTGLGLSISHGIARAHGGELSLDTTLKNTTFVLKLPLVPPAGKGSV